MFSKSALISLVLGVLYVNALSVPVAREPAPEPEFQDVGPSDHLRSREAEPGTQELEARILPLLGVAAGALGLAGAATVGGMAAGGMFSKKNKREILDDLLSREARDWVKGAKPPHKHTSKREPSPGSSRERHGHPSHPRAPRQ